MIELAMLLIGLGGAVLLLAFACKMDSRGYQETLEERLAEAMADIADRDAEIARLRSRVHGAAR